MEMHYREFVERKSFTYSILDGDEVIGCVYIYPARIGELTPTCTRGCGQVGPGWTWSCGLP